MSGGVDSSVAALLLKRWGYDVVGVFMRSYNVDGCAERDSEDARQVAEKLDIPFYVWDFEEEYKKKVVDYMICGYKRGETPNPDVVCNREIKFGLFLARALRAGSDFVATGHYVRARRYSLVRTGGSAAPADAARLRSRHRDFFEDQIRRVSESFSTANTGSLSLFEAKDKDKDQSYFLWTLTQKELRHCLFPIGEYLKSEVREIARKAGLPTAEKKDSQGICFLGKVTLRDFLKQYLPEKRGAILSLDGEKIGEHQGAHFYTVGQRHIGVGCQPPGVKGRHFTPPVYVVEKDVRKNTIVVAEGAENPALYRKEIELAEVNIINPLYTNIFESAGMAVMARVRYRQPLAPATLRGKKLIFDTPQKFVAPGQSAVFYSKNGEMLGGGVIQ